MDWRERLATAEAQKRRAEQLAAQAAKDAHVAQEARLAVWHDLVQELERVRRALIDSNWPGAYRHREGLFKMQAVAEMSVTEITVKAGGVDDGYVDLPGQINYYKHPPFKHDPQSRGVVVFARVGVASSSTRERVGSIEFLGSHIRQLTPDMVVDAAARYCVDREVDLPL